MATHTVQPLGGNAHCRQVFDTIAEAKAAIEKLEAGEKLGTKLDHGMGPFSIASDYENGNGREAYAETIHVPVYYDFVIAEEGTEKCPYFLCKVGELSKFTSIDLKDTRACRLRNQRLIEAYA